jgi:predicted lipoprotein with Yx(FWY)xxD motif
MTKFLLAVAIIASSLALACCGTSRPATTTTVAATTSTAAVSASATRHADPPPRPPHRVVAVRVTWTAYGEALADRRGFALYRFTHDSSTHSTCYGACATAWPPYIVGKQALAAGRGARSGLLGTVRRRDGRLQVTYAGHPLYYYVGDRHPGQVLCQAVVEYGGGWYVVAANGQLIR